jgi:hypothetical protein
MQQDDDGTGRPEKDDRIAGAVRQALDARRPQPSAGFDESLLAVSSRRDRRRALPIALAAAVAVVAALVVWQLRRSPGTGDEAPPRLAAPPPAEVIAPPDAGPPERPAAGPPAPAPEPDAGVRDSHRPRRRRRHH